MFWGPADQMHPDTPGGGVEAIYTDSLLGLFPGPFREERGGENNAVFVIDQSGGYWSITRTAAQH